jgi:hypothetical protein
MHGGSNAAATTTTTAAATTTTTAATSASTAVSSWPRVATAINRADRAIVGIRSSLALLVRVILAIGGRALPSVRECHYRVEGTKKNITAIARAISRRPSRKIVE